MNRDVEYSRDYAIVDPVLLRAQQELEAPTTRNAQIDAFACLIASSEVDAVCVALDHYRHGEAMERHGAANPFSAFADRVGDQARAILSTPCAVHGVVDPKECAKLYVGAIDAIRDSIRDGDAQLVNRLLSESVDCCVRLLATSLAVEVLRCDDDPRLQAVLRQIALDDSERSIVRQTALRALSRIGSVANVDVLSQCSKSPDLETQIWAAVGLASIDIETHRPLLERLVAGWPEDAPYPATDVIDKLEAFEPADRDS